MKNIKKSVGRKAPEQASPQKYVAQVKDFNYEEFKKLAEKTPFTQAEWAAILHLSERTLQRYAKNNSSFAPIHAERFYQIQELIQKGKKLFGKISLFYEWIHARPASPEGEISFNLLTSFEGIQQIQNQLGRLEHGLLA